MNKFLSLFFVLFFLLLSTVSAVKRIDEHNLELDFKENINLTLEEFSFVRMRIKEGSTVTLTIGESINTFTLTAINKDGTTTLFFNKNKEGVIDGVIISVDPSHAMVDLGEKKYTGYLPKSEITWLFCDDVLKELKVGDPIKVKLLKINEWHNNITVSSKQTELNRYDEYVCGSQVGNVVKAKVISYHDNCVRVKIFYNGEYCVEGYVHKSEISFILYVDNDNMIQLLRKDSVYSFLVKKYFESAKIVEVSRKAFLRSNISALRLDGSYNVFIADSYRGFTFVSCDEFEAKFRDRRHGDRIGDSITVSIENKIADKNLIEVK